MVRAMIRRLLVAILLLCGVPGARAITLLAPPEIEKRQDKVARQLGFVIKDHHMILYAERCPHCPAK